MNICVICRQFDEANWNLFFARHRPDYVYFTRSAHPRHGAVQQNISYSGTLAGEIVERQKPAASRSRRLEEKSIRIMHEMSHAENGEIAATCEITGVHLDREGAHTSGAVCAHPRSATPRWSISVTPPNQNWA